MSAGSKISERMPPAPPGSPYLWVRLHTALSILAAGEDVLARMAEPETAFESGDRERFRLLSAARAARSWLVGHGAGDELGRPGPDSAFGGAFAALGWTREELDRYYETALADWHEGAE